MSAQEQDPAAARTTIAGSEPPENRHPTGAIPRGIEVLVKKAAVDPEFRELLFAQRGAAAAAIELELDPTENAILSAIPQEQLAQIISQTTVPLEQRRVFLGRLAVAMVAVLGAGLAGCKPERVGVTSLGARPAPPPATDGIRPDRPPNSPPPPTRGIQPDTPGDATTNVIIQGTTRGIRPDRP
jgi:hypothetical protein